MKHAVLVNIQLVYHALFRPVIFRNGVVDLTFYHLSWRPIGKPALRVFFPTQPITTCVVAILGHGWCLRV